MKKDIYKGKPWKNMDEYFKLAEKYKCYGDELEKRLKEENKKKVPWPVIRPPKQTSDTI